MDDDTQTVDVTITRADLFMASLWAPRRTAVLYIVIWLGLFAMNVPRALKPPGFHGTTGGIVLALIVAAIVATIFTVGALLLTALCVQMVNRKSRGALGAHTYRLTPQGLVESTSVNESLLRWTAGLRAWRVPGYLFIRTPPLGVHVIPLRSFATEAAASKFWDCLQMYLRRASNTKG